MSIICPWHHFTCG